MPFLKASAKARYLAFNDDTLKNIIQYYSINPEELDIELHRYAKKLLDTGKLQEAWQVLLADY